MFQAILGDHLLLSIIILLALLLVPLLILRNGDSRESHGIDRRKRPRQGIDRRA